MDPCSADMLWEEDLGWNISVMASCSPTTHLAVRVSIYWVLWFCQLSHHILVSCWAETQGCSSPWTELSSLLFLWKSVQLVCTSQPCFKWLILKAAFIYLASFSPYMRKRGIKERTWPHLKEMHHCISLYVQVFFLCLDTAWGCGTEGGVARWIRCSAVPAHVVLWRDAATPDRQMCSAHSFPIAWTQLTETRSGWHKFDKTEVWNCWPVLFVCFM